MEGKIIMNPELDNITSFLFNRLFGEELTSKEEDVLVECAENAIREFGWEETFSSWKAYLKNNCHTSESVLNFADLFWWFGGQDHIIPDPYDFLGYFYYHTGVEPDEDGNLDILDSIATTILPKAGYQEADLVLNPQYMPENDPRLLKAVEKYQNKMTEENSTGY